MPLPKTSREAREILEAFRRATGLRPNVWARAALGYSLSLQAEPEAMKYDSDGTEFQEKAVFGPDEAPLLALLRQRVGRVLEAEEERALVKLHIERGVRLLRDDFDRLNRRGDAFLLSLVESCAKYGRIPADESKRPEGQAVPGASYGVTVQLGTEARSQSPVFHTLTSPGAAPHVGV
ncbi:DndE family protein, partial [Candidatus Bathyarchaeota archaeon]|nr:DndE family protein [Candidatus Bathyarchaeota archaeon]